MLLPLPRRGSRIAGPLLSLKNTQPSPSSSLLRLSRCHCGCRNSSVCSCSCCVHPASSASLNQVRAYSSSGSGSGSGSCCSSSSTSTIRPFSTSSPHANANTTSHSSPTKMPEYRLKDLSSLADIPNMEKVECEVDGIEGGKVLVLRFNDQVHAMSPRCTHYGAPLKNGVVAPDGRITCPWHGGVRPFPFPFLSFSLGQR